MNNKSVKIQKDVVLKDFDEIKLQIASPEEITSWSYGEITKPETINYRTQKPERDGLFDERVFGPVKDWECYCGKYKKIRYKGVICDRCGVEVTRSQVRRERMGHIELVVPVVHVWYVRGGGGIISTILNMTISDIESVTYFAAYVVTRVNEEMKTQALEQLQKEFDDYPYHSAKDPKYFNRLIKEFSDLDIEEELHQYHAWILDQPENKKIYFRSRFRSWLKNSQHYKETSTSLASQYSRRRYAKNRW